MLNLLLYEAVGALVFGTVWFVCMHNHEVNKLFLKIFIILFALIGVFVSFQFIGKITIQFYHFLVTTF